MLNFENLNILDQHIHYLKEKIKNEDIFLVGGCIRDILLGIENDPKDIDFTMQGEPTKIYKKIDKKGISHFITEKFGTITLIKKSELTTGRPDDLMTKYELTPLRTEGGYEDFRHPGKINRSNDLLLDSNRRDLTINCIYYYNTKYKIKNTKENSPSKDKDTPEDFRKTLEKNGFIYLPDSNLFIIQNHELISKLFKNGQFQTKFFAHLISLLKDTGNCSLDTQKPVGFLLDPHQGIQDLIAKKIKTVGTPDNRFTEDALRIVRALRFPNILNIKLKEHKITTNNFFDFDKDTRNSIKKNHKLVEKIAKERLKDELIKVFENANPFGFIALLDEVKLLEFFFPSLYETKHIEQPVRYHPFDVYAHTMLTLFELQKINCDYLVKLGMLYHDVGKVAQFGAYKDDLTPEQIREIISGPLNHRKSGPALVKKDFSKLGFSNKEIDEIARYVENHHKPEEILFAKEENKIKKARKFLSETGYQRGQNILDMCIADRMGQYNPLQGSKDTSEVYELKKILKSLHEEEGQFTMKQLAVKGTDIIKKFKLTPSPKIGELLDKALNRVIDDLKTRNNKKEIFKYLEQIGKKK